MIASRLAALRQGSLVRKSLRALFSLLIVIVTFAIGIGIYAGVRVLWPLFTRTSDPCNKVALMPSFSFKPDANRRCVFVGWAVTGRA